MWFHFATLIRAWNFQRCPRNYSSKLEDWLHHGSYDYKLIGWSCCYWVGAFDYYHGPCHLLLEILFRPFVRRKCQKVALGPSFQHRYLDSHDYWTNHCCYKYWCCWWRIQHHWCSCCTCLWNDWTWCLRLLLLGHYEVYSWRNQRSSKIIITHTETLVMRKKLKF